MLVEPKALVRRLSPTALRLLEAACGYNERRAFVTRACGGDSHAGPRLDPRRCGHISRLSPLR